MLFNIPRDPHERRNLAAERPAVFKQLKARRDELLEECLPDE